MRRMRSFLGLFVAAVLAVMFFCIPASADSGGNSVAIEGNPSLSNGNLVFNLRVSTTQELAESGYSYGVRISNRQDYSSVIGESTTGMNSAANGEVFSLEVYNFLVPGATYYAKGFLRQNIYDASGNYINFLDIFEETVPTPFTGPGSDSDFTEVFFNGTGTIDQNNDQFLFTAPSAGMYAVSGTTTAVNNIQVYRSNGDRAADAYQSGNSVACASFYATAGEKLYIKANSFSGNGTITVTTAAQVLPELDLGQAMAVDSGRTVCFTAKTAGYYNIAYSPANSEYGIQVMDVGTGNWIYSSGSAGLSLTAGETAYVQASYPQWNQGQSQQLSIVATEVTPPKANSIEAISTGVSPSGNVTVVLQVSATAQLAESGYFYGVEISNRQDFQNDQTSFQGEQVGPILKSIANNEEFTFELHQPLVPGATYYLKGVLQQQNYDSNGNMTNPTDICEGTRVIGFTATGSDTDFTQLALNGTGTVEQYNNNQFLFTAPSAGMYAVSGTTSAVIGINVCRSNGNLAANAHQHDSSDVISAVFYADKDEKLYINAYANNENGAITATRVVLPELELGQALGIDSDDIVCFTAADEGYYTFAYSPAAQYGIDVMDISSATWNHNSGSVGMTLSAGETVYLMPHYPQGSEGQLSLIAKRVIPPNTDSIEVAAATNVTNVGATFTFTVSATEKTAQDGYRVGIETAQDEDFTGQISGRFLSESDSIANNEERTFTVSDCVPGQSFWYRAVMLNSSGDVICEGSTVRQLTLSDDLNGFTELTKDKTIEYEQGQNRFYFDAQTSGVYAVRTVNSDNVNIRRSDGNGNGKGRGDSAAILCGMYIEARERVFIYTRNTDDEAVYSIKMTDGYGVLPTLQLDQPVDMSRGEFYSFTAPADGEYSFAANNSDFLLRWLSPEGVWMDPQSASFSTELTRGSTIWLLSGVYGPGKPTQATLTVTTGASGLFTFPSSLKTLEAYACAGLNIQKADFSNCANLESVQSKAFDGCSNLTTVVFPKADVEIAGDAFDNCGSVTLIAPAGGLVQQFANSHNNISFLPSE